jgi:hypothetical protein
MKETLGLVAVALSIIGHAPYIVDVVRKKTKPHIFTWIVWSVVTILAFFGQWASGGGAGSWTTAVSGVIAILIMVLALSRGTKDISTLDKVFFIAALLAIVPWYLTKDPTFSVVIITVIDVFAFLPTLRKTFRDPSSETFVTYALNVVRHGLSIFALGAYNLATVLYPAALMIMNVSLVVAMMWPRRKSS